MHHPSRRHPCRSALSPAALVVLAFALGGCSWLSWGSRTPASASSSTVASPVQIEHAGLLATRNGRPELGLTLSSAATRTLWVMVRFQTPGGTADCQQMRELAPQARASFACPQPHLVADTDYPVSVTAYEDAELVRPLAPITARLRFSSGDLRAVGQR